MSTFSCRGCIHNPAQSLSLGRGAGFCMHWRRPIAAPERTTCRFLHRKDLPRPLVEQSLREHQEEFADQLGPADLFTGEVLSPSAPTAQPVMDTQTTALSLKELPEPPPILYASTVDARKALAHACLVRRSLLKNHPSRVAQDVALLIDDLDRAVHADPATLVPEDAWSAEDQSDAACWEIFFARLAGVQEFGFRTECDVLIALADHASDAIAETDWVTLRAALRAHKPALLAALANIREREIPRPFPRIMGVEGNAR